ncbi:glycoside hydrolase family 27 protein [Lentzea sp. NPDC060358]|uniref:glycoside hydrolase family 27 protein n=1 Tax=Lentzea sp. NPDC060358 TaxID=3347103 RepID=UPI003655A975
MTSRRWWPALAVLVLVLVLGATAWFVQPGPPAPASAQAAGPPMGWNSWNRFGCDIDEQLIRGQADALAGSGLRDAGYSFVVVDDCWMAHERDAQGRLQADPATFPSGMKALGDHVHGLGLEFGLYSSAGAETCEGRPASRDHEEVDARTFAEWGVDFLKYDYCESENGDRPAGAPARDRYAKMSAALRATGRPIVLSVVEWGDERPWEWAHDAGGTMWRTTRDIKPDWPNITGTLDQQAGLERYARPGGWNDPDMLQVGNGLDEDETQFHMTMWCLLNAPLMAGNDLSAMDPITSGALLNRALLDVQRDFGDGQGRRLRDDGDTEVWAKGMSDGSVALALLNRGTGHTTVTTSTAEAGLPDAGSYRVLDLWNGEQPATSGPLGGDVAGHGVMALRVWPRR